MEMDNLHQILIIDDDIQFTDSKTRSWLLNYNFDLIAEDNWEDGMKTLRSEEFSAVVLDVKCRKDKRSLPDEGVGLKMLHDVVDYLDKSNKDIPVFVFTGFEGKKEEWEKDGYLKTISEQIKVFVKNSEDEEKLIQEIKNSISTSNHN